MERYVALLRGVNVGGKNKIAMKNLASLFSDAKCHNVATYIQSGNVVFHSDARNALKVGAAICTSIQEQFGFQTNILLRTQRDLERIQAANPYPEVENVHVMFLSGEPGADRIALMDPNRSAPDQFTVMGSEIYLFMPNGMGRTKLSNAYFDSKLKVVSTARNWRTVQKLSEMMNETN